MIQNNCKNLFNRNSYELFSYLFKSESKFYQYNEKILKYFNDIDKYHIIFSISYFIQFLNAMIIIITVTIIGDENMNIYNNHVDIF